LRVDAAGVRSPFAGPEESADLMAKFGERSVGGAVIIF
jgi:hypothetical protein